MILAHVVETGGGSLNAAYLWVSIAVGVVVLLFGGGGAWRIGRYLRAQTLRNARIDEATEATLDPKTGLVAQGRQLRDLQNSMRPNGLDTDQLGDIAKRTEQNVSELRDDFKQHLGVSDEAHEQFRREIAQLRRTVSGKVDKRKEAPQ